MAGTCNSDRCLPTSALSRAEVTGDFGGSLMRQSSKVRVHAPIVEFYEKRKFIATCGTSEKCHNRTHAHAAYSNQFLKRLPRGMLPG